MPLEAMLHILELRVLNPNDPQMPMRDSAISGQHSQMLALLEGPKAPAR